MEKEKNKFCLFSKKYLKFIDFTNTKFILELIFEKFEKKSFREMIFIFIYFIIIINV